MINEWLQGLVTGIVITAISVWLIARWFFDGLYDDEADKTEKGGNNVREYIPRSEKYYLASYRYLELKAFCRQYRDWQVGLKQCYGIKGNGFGQVIRGSEHSDPTERAVELAEKYRNKIDMVELAAKLADESLASYIILNVTQGLSFDALDRMSKRPPCGINQFYEARQKFFWELDQLKE